MYGLNCTPLFTRPAGAVAAPTTNTLFTLGVGPVGLLYKDIASVDEAIAHGGIMLLRPSDGQFVFYAGDTLKQVLAKDLLGKIATRKDPRASVWKDQIDAAHVQWVKWNYPIAYGADNWKTEYAKTVKFTRESNYIDVFDTTSVVHCFAIVTGATRGHGALNSVKWVMATSWTATPTQAYSFMATDTRANTSMDKIMLKRKAALIEAMPEDVREYYDATFADACDGFKLVRPTISAMTTWSGTQVCDIPVVRTLCMVTPQKFSDAYFIEDGYGKGPLLASGRLRNDPGWDAAVLYYTYGSGWSSPNQYPPFVYSDGRPPTGGGDGSLSVMQVRRSYVWDRTLGKYLVQTSALPVLALDGYETLVESIPCPTGVIEGYQAGALRDAQLLGRSLVTKDLFGTVAANYGDIESLVRLTLPDEQTLVARPGVPTEAEATALVTGLVGSAAIEYTDDAFSCGTFAYEMERFGREWDAKTKAHVEAMR